MAVTITGLTARQRLVAELLWSIQDPAEVERICRLDKDARIVRDMILAAELDNYDSVAEDVKALILSLR